jgi:hypothetical protein
MEDGGYRFHPDSSPCTRFEMNSRNCNCGDSRALEHKENNLWRLSSLVGHARD